MSPKSEGFYTNLPLQKTSVNKLVGNPDHFQQIPPDWEIILTDIKQSTKAVAEGKHSLVNLVATGSIIAALNIAYREGISIPFFFGGDGATLIIPKRLRSTILDALYEHSQNTRENFELILRVGSMPVAQVYEADFKLKISKVSMSPIYDIPIILGEGLKFAESQIKSDKETEQHSGKTGYLNLEGMECRWDKIKPPLNHFEVISLLLESKEEAEQGRVYKEVLDIIEKIYGSQEQRQPISIQSLKLSSSLEKIRTEMKVRLGKNKFSYLMENWLRTLIGKLYFRVNKNGQAYLSNLVKLSDTLVIDGRINTVISGNEKQRKQLIEKLDELEGKGDLIYGLHTSPESIMSCYVRDRKDQHIHFVDGSGGGYTQAAKVFKQKLRNQSS
ncbi:MAG: DUF3095 domain-containing protein [Bacteroidota bacterium]